ncbi:hypothetical protein [Rhodanobacter sp. DHB23]|uniref:hypothetical protein n=1 Tax=Rhodanobacter sp. DHB23 TaxID=2775923 RepID=UPI00177E3485|nr:hypothetical protein [Rhodanobacter sp. DHB23]MBD8874150.1 hypothetical protein [Rhodanobacter sp. DHB23]
MRELEHLLPELTPPPDGLRRLQRSLHTRHVPKRARIRPWLPVATGACALALLALAWLPGMIQRQRRDDALTQALLQAVAMPPLTDGIHVDHGAALLLHGGPADTRTYLIVSSSTGH